MAKGSGRQPDPRIVEAAKRAAQLWCDQHKTGVTGDFGQTGAARAAAEMGIAFKPYEFSRAVRGQIGLPLAKRIAAIYKTTPDGLVRKMLDGDEHIALCDLEGWKDAVAQARTDRSGAHLDPRVWTLIGLVTVPIDIGPATLPMVLDVAKFLNSYAKTEELSHTRLKAAAG